MLTCSSLRPLSSVIQEARRKHANQDMVASSSHVAFATMTLWADHVPAELLAKTKRQLHRTHVMVFSAKQAVIARRTTGRERERETWEACTVVGASVVVAAATEHGPAEESSAWKAFFPSLFSSSARQVIVSLPTHRCCCISKTSVRMSAHTEGNGRDGEPPTYRRMLARFVCRGRDGRHPKRKASRT